MERAAAAAPVVVRHGGVVLPPGFRFHPTDEELVVQYLRRKAFGLPLPAAVIPDLHNLFKLDPWTFLVRAATGTSTSSPCGHMRRGGGGSM
ncbi:hypothetical protein OsJ_28084 [Oryza sativa Japonica Group]|uniref:NAC domain-containing protein n=1 Tax=Oryza sativa subsp. japonica TaxID=39947 RepID=A3BV88_ORYSJ|nr:hypothetical protein OsJ_28084 [Oryza sativa Japonica Group]